MNATVVSRFPVRQPRAPWRIGGLIAAVALGFAAPAGAVTLATPSNLELSFTHVEPGWAYGEWTWQDNANNEDGYILQRSFTGESGTFADLATLPANSTAAEGYFDVTPGVTQYFRVKAYQGSDRSDPSNTYVLLVPPVTFNAPSNAVATAVSEDSVRVGWNDNSTSEERFYIEYREPSWPDFLNLGWMPFNSTNVVISGFSPGVDYEFRVRGYDSNPVQYTPYSDVGTVHMPFNGPANLSATPTGEQSVQLQWQDNSSQEHGYAIEARLQGDTDWARLFYVAANSTSVTLDSTDLRYPATTYEFRVLAAYQMDDMSIVDSDPSNVASATRPFNAPSDLQAAATDESTVNLTWQDNSQVEDAYEILTRIAGDTQWTLWETTASNATARTVTDLPPATALEFAVRAKAMVDGYDYYSDISAVAAAATKDVFLGRDYEPIQLGVPFSYQIETTTQTSLTSVVVGTLPDGLTYNSGTAAITGTPAVSGVFDVPMEAHFADGWTANRTLTLRIVRPPAAPVAGAVIPDQDLAPGGDAAIPLADKFSDPDTESAVRMSTTLGDIDILLYESLTPLTVSNFLGYVNRGDYAGVSFHRSIPGFVVQGGGYEATAAPDSFSHIPTTPSPPNEPGVSNVRGTIAMAKRSGDPNSATSEFFFNLADNNDPYNPSSLDNQNGGFSAFGRIPAAGMAIADAIAALPRGSYTIDLHGTSTDIPDWPMNAPSAPPTMDQSKLVLINSIAPLPALEYAVTGNSNPAVVDAAVQAGLLELSGLAPGQSTLTVTATDLDGNSVSQTFDVLVTQAYGQWAGGTTFPNDLSAPADDPERDGRRNLLEFAFLTDPCVPDAANGQPVVSVTRNNGVNAASITFRLRKFAAALTYRVERSTDLASWEPIWHSDEGLSLAHVQAEDKGDHYLVTVHDPAPPPQGNCFVRVVVESVAP